MEWLFNNWYILLGFVAVGFMSGYYVSNFVKQPTETKVQNIKEWLKYAVMEAEKQLGSGTGQAKLRLVYSMALEKFGWLSLVSFEVFSAWVDTALIWLNGQLECNESIKKYVSE